MKWTASIALLLLASQLHAQDGGYDAQDADGNVRVAWADVLRVDPIYQQVQTSSPREVCDDVPSGGPVDNGNRAAGTVLGAIVGGVLGNTVGKGDGRTAATVAGAVVGGAVGNNLERSQDPHANGMQPQCRSVQEVSNERRLVAYDVQYRYRGEIFMSRLDYDPGNRLRVRVSVEPAE